jgi:hypothetical protein
MGKRSAKENAQPFEEFLKEYQGLGRRCKTCSTDNQEVLDNIVLYVEHRVADKTQVSWDALARYIKETYNRKLSRNALVNHCMNCLGDLSKQLAKHEGR